MIPTLDPEPDKWIDELQEDMEFEPLIDFLDRLREEPKQDAPILRRNRMNPPNHPIFALPTWLIMRALWPFFRFKKNHPWNLRKPFTLGEWFEFQTRMFIWCDAALWLAFFMPIFIAVWITL